MFMHFAGLVVAAACLFAALRVHKSSGKHTKATKIVGVVLAFVAGLGALATFVGDWMSAHSSILGVFAAGGLIVAAAILVVDCLLDGKPDKPAFWAAFALPLLIVIGLAQIPQAKNQIGDGFHQVSSQIGSGNDSAGR